MMRNTIILIFLLLYACHSMAQNKQLVWSIGENDNSGKEFALSNMQYDQFVQNDFGWEDKYYLIGRSDPGTDWPYIIPGTSDTWGGTWGTSGWRSSTLNILFGINSFASDDVFHLTIDILDSNSDDLPLLKVMVNGRAWKFRIPAFNSNSDIESSAQDEYLVEVPIPTGYLKEGGNEVSITVLEGSWIKLDQIRLESEQSVELREETEAFLRSVKPAEYSIQTASGPSPVLLVDVEHLNGEPEIKVRIDDKMVFQEMLENGRYLFEVPIMDSKTEGQYAYEILIDDDLVQKSQVKAGKYPVISPAEYVDTKIGTAHSRWMIAPGPWMPFSMVKISPDNQNNGWQAGYEPTFESIGTFSHIHEWTMAGLGTMPTNGPLETFVGDQKDPDSGYRSRIDKGSEKGPIAYYKVNLTDYDIQAELTSTTRCAMQRYTFPKDREGSRILLDLVIPSEYRYRLLDAEIRQTGKRSIEGYSHQLSPNTWSGGISQEYTVHFVMEFDRDISDLSFWTEKGISEEQGVKSFENSRDAGAVISFDTKVDNVVQVRSAISYVSTENARLNLNEEISKPFGWNFEDVRGAHLEAWNQLMGRVKITTNDRREKVRFYTNMYRALCSRNIFSDVNGEWRDADEVLQKMDDPASPALGCDAFWNTFWNLNQFWNLVTPEWSNRWVKSQLTMYETNGWLAKGPAGMEYIPVMVAEHEVPLIVGAYQMGIRDYDVDMAYEAVRKMQITPGRKVGGGYAGNRDLKPYLKYGYVPFDKGRFSNSLEYAFDDWTVSQFAHSLGKDKDYKEFAKRGDNWRNVIDPSTGYARMKDAKGKWLEDFDPYKSGANKHYVEGNAWQLTFFVPQNVIGLADMIGKDRFVERLDWGFTESDKTRYNGLNDQYWDYPVIQGNQQSMHFAFLFNWVGHPWLTQKWSRSILDRYYGYGIANAYLGDEDQGQMSAWFVMAALGLFQTDGGCSSDPHYEIASPLYEEVEIDLGKRFGRGETFVIKANGASRKNKYVQSARLNGKELQDFKFPAIELLKGGLLELDMGAEPNEEWGVVN